jgi:hypothetical protein
MPKDIATPASLFPDLSEDGDHAIALFTAGRFTSWEVFKARMGSNEPITDMWFEWDLILFGMRGAAERYNSSVGQGLWWEARAAVGEALWWISSADEFIFKHAPWSTTRRAHYEALGATRHGRAIGGLTYLRNRANHQVALGLVKQELAVTQDGILPVIHHPDGTDETLELYVQFRMHGQGKVPESGLFFGGSDFLPEADPSFKETFGRDEMYSDEVAFREAGAVLRAAVETLDLTVAVRASYG